MNCCYSNALTACARYFVLTVFVAAMSVATAEVPSDAIKGIVTIPMRDGFKLTGEVYRFAGSDGGLGGTDHSVTVISTIYNLDFQRDKYAPGIMGNGRIYVGVHMRDAVSGGAPFEFGTYDSAYQASEDAYDIAEWIARQPWCDGNIGFKGGSGNGVGGSAALWANHPNIKVVSVTHTSSNFHDYWLYENGVRRDTFGLIGNRGINVSARLGSKPDTVFNDKQEWLDWTAKRAKEGNVAYFESAGLYDIFEEAALDNYSVLQPYGRAHVRLEPRWHGIAAQWDGTTYNLYLGRNAYDTDYDDYMAGSIPTDSSMIDYTVIRPDSHTYFASNEWPIEHTEVPYYLKDDGSLSLDVPTTTGNSLTYQYDPSNPMPPAGGNAYISGYPSSLTPLSNGYNYGALDQSPIAARTDQLRFESAPMAIDTQLTGPIEIDLFISTDVEDTLFVVKIVAIDPVSGYEALLKDGVAMARYYDGPGAGQRLVGGQVYRLQFSTWTASAVIEAGSKLGVHITSSAAESSLSESANYYEAHPNSFDSVSSLTGAAVANNTVHMSSAYPSSVILPMIDFSPSAPQIRISGAGNDIENGDLISDVADDSAFGPVDLLGSATSVYTIHNDSVSHSLSLTGSPRVNVSGAASGDFTVVAQPASPVVVSGSQNFSIEFAPSAPGLREATITIESDDPYESPFSYAVSGWGASAGAAEIAVCGEDSDWLVDGDTDPSWEEWTDFEEVRKFRSKTRSFTIHNKGLSDLSLVDQGGGVYVSLSGDSEFSVVSQPSVTIAPGSSSSFEIRYAPNADGMHTANVQIQSNDADEVTFDFALAGSAANYLPVVNASQSDVSIAADQTTVFSLDHEIFYDPDGDAFQYSLQLEGGGAAPAWLSINGITGDITGSPSSEDVGSYDLEIVATESGERGTVLSETFTLVAAFAPPSITSQPADTSVVAGNTASFTVVAEGSETLQYQWYEGGSGDLSSPVSGASDATLVTDAIATPKSFWVRVTDGNLETVDSDTASVSLIDAPVITVQPLSSTALVGGSKVLSVVATGGSLSYQWYLGNSGTTATPISDATDASYTTPALSADTNFWVRVTNVAGSHDSDTAAITVTASAPGMLFNLGSTENGNWNNFPDNGNLSGVTTSGLTGLVYDDGSSATGVTLDVYASSGSINVSARGPNPATYAVDWLTAGASEYAWRLNGNGSVYRFTVHGLSAGNYTLEAYSYQNVGSSYAYDRMALSGGIVGATGTTIDEFDTTLYNANTDSAGKLAKWTGITVLDGESIELEVAAGSTENALINAFRLKPATITPTGPTLFGSPVSTEIDFGESANLSVAANGNGTLLYQWYQGEAGDTSLPVAGATEATFDTPLLTSGTFYWVRVTDDNGSVDSDAALVEVNTSIYASWIGSYALTGDDTLADADPDADTAPNIIEYLLGLNPSAADFTYLNGTLDGANLLAIHLLSSIAQPPSDLDVTMKGSDDLVDWDVLDMTLTTSDNGDGTWNFTYKQDTVMPNDGKYFIRLLVDTTAP